MTYETLKPLIAIAKQRSSLPILNYIRVTAGRAEATDHDMWLSVATTLPDGFYEAKKLEYALQYGETPIAETGMDAADWPTLEDDQAPRHVTFDLAELKSVAFAMSEEETRYYLNGVCLEDLGGGGVNLVATDGHRLAARNATAQADAQFIIHAAAVKCLLGIAKAGSVKADMRSLSMVATYEGYTLVSKLIDATFPDWRRVVPTGNDITIEVQGVKAMVAKALAKAKAEGRSDGFGKLVLDIPGGGQIGLNARYVKEALNGKDDIRVMVSDASSPVIIHGGLAPISVLMPYRL